jgi:GntR family transcriptional repressor for pyruvate dehydrogenase complex
VTDRRARRSGLADQVAGHLLHDITEGVYTEGARLPPEPVLAEDAGVSRLTLREAVKSLAQRGVLRVEQGRGTFVNPSSQWLPLDPELLTSLVRRDHGLASQLTEVRAIVEVGAAALAARRRSAEDLHRMQDAVERAEIALAEADVSAFSAADIDFHQAVLGAVGNRFVAPCWSRSTVPYRRSGGRPRRMPARRGARSSCTVGSWTPCASARPLRPVR